MNCDQVQEQLSEYIDGRIDSKARAEVEEHLSSCVDCTELAASLTSTAQMVAAEPQVEPPMGFTTRVMAHVQDEASKPSLWQRWSAWSRLNIPMQAAAVILIAVLAVFLYQNSERRQQPSQMAQRSEEPVKPRAADKTAPEIAEPSNADPVDSRTGAESATREQVQEFDQARRSGADEGARALAPGAPSSASDDNPGDADREIVLRLRDSASEAKRLADRIEPSVARRESRSSLPQDVQKSLAEARSRARQTGEAQVVWLNLPIDAYEQFSQDLTATGIVESNVAHRSQIATAARSGGSMRVKVTILPATPKSK
jgi:hypothetical protein